MARGKANTKMFRRGKPRPRHELALGSIETGDDLREPNWWTPNRFLQLEALQFADQHDIDPAVAIRLLKDPGPVAPGQDYFEERTRFFWPNRSMVQRPEETVKGMDWAGRALARALRLGERIAVFADYDPDGVCAAEVMRLSLDSYLQRDCASCEGSGSVDCGDCRGSGRVGGRACPVCGSGEDPGSIECPDCVGIGLVADKERLLFGYANAQSGFGLTEQFVREAHAAGAKTLVTVDCGSSSVAEVALAKQLGMRVIVVDHHGIDGDNPADYHLNPHLQGEGASANTGAQLAWKLGAATQLAIEGRTRPEHWQRAMYLAGFGARADMGPATDPENRAFFWYPLDRAGEAAVPPGLALLAQQLGEDAANPGNVVQTSACMNLAKRTPRARAEDVAALLAAPDAESARPVVERLVGLYREAQPARRAMLERSLAQAEQAPERAFAVGRIDDQPDWAGYAGVVASGLSRRSGRPGLVFTKRETDALGQTLFKFSIRNESRFREAATGELIQDAGMRAACTVRRIGPDGQEVAEPVIGGHLPTVVSGTCTEQQIQAVIDAAEDWAQRSQAQRPWREKAAYSGASEFLADRCVDPKRLARIERQARRLGPFSSDEEHRPVSVSVSGRISEPQLDPTSGLYHAELDLGEGITRAVLLTEEGVSRLPAGREAEWALDLGASERPLLRNWHVAD